MELQFLAKVFDKPIRWLAEPQIFPAAMNVFPLLLPYSPSMLSLIFIWAAYIVASNCMWRLGKRNLHHPWKSREE